MDRKTKKYDLIVIGSGSAGLSVGLGMNELGFKVLIIDKEDKRIGGDCLNFGCVPSKSLIHVSRVVHQARKAEAFGIQSSGSTNYDAVKSYINSVQETIRQHENVRFLSKSGLDVALGIAEFSGKNSVKVDGREYHAKKIVIATGSVPNILPFKGIQNVKVFTNENIFDIDDRPKKLLVIGAGPIGMELGQALSRLGSEVTVLDAGTSILGKESAEISDVLYEQCKAEGITFYMGVNGIEFTPSSVLFEDKNKNRREIALDAVLIATGRKVELGNLELQKAGIKVNKMGIEVNDFLQTSNKSVYVAGDIAGGHKFSHAAELHAMILLNNFLSPFKKKLKYDHFSWVTFTDPEVASFGLNESQLTKRKISYEKIVYNFSEDDRATIESYRYGKLVIFTGNSFFPGGNRKILGGSMVAPNAGELIQELILANSAGLGTKDLFNKIHPYPVASRVNKLAIVAKYRSELNPLIKKMIRLFY